MLTLIQYEMKKTAFMKILCGFALFISQAFVMPGTATDNFRCGRSWRRLADFLQFSGDFHSGLIQHGQSEQGFKYHPGLYAFYAAKTQCLFLIGKDC